jgi:hypothetical protein
MWPWLALVAAIVIGRAISLQSALRILGWAAILLVVLFALLAEMGAPPG